MAWYTTVQAIFARFARRESTDTHGRTTCRGQFACEAFFCAVATDLPGAGMSACTM